MRLAVALAWLGGGIYGIVVFLRHRHYINSLPPGRGNQQIKRRHKRFLAFAVGAIAVGLVYLFPLLREYLDL
jgi:hypothetical protein